MTSTTIYRPALENDVATIARLLTELNLAEGSDKVVDEMALAGSLFARDRKMDLAALVAEENKQVVGVVLYYLGFDVLTTSYGYHLADIVVAEGQRGRGIGSGLLAALSAQNLAQGGEWISLTVLESNTRAHAFYTKHHMVHVPVDFFAGGRTTLAAIAKNAGTK